MALVSRFLQPIQSFISVGGPAFALCIMGICTAEQTLSLGIALISRFL